jgi:hypothetical protein
MSKHLWRERYDFYCYHFNRFNCNDCRLIGLGWCIVIAAILDPERDINRLHHGAFRDAQAGIEHWSCTPGRSFHFNGNHQGNPGTALEPVGKLAHAVS